MRTNAIQIVILILILGLGILFSTSSFLMNLPQEKIDSIYSLLNTISLAFFGILSTVLALLASLVNHAFISKMQKTGHFRILMKSIFWNLFCFFILILFTFLYPMLSIGISIAILKINLIIFSISIFLLIDIGKKFWFVFCGLNITKSKQ